MSIFGLIVSSFKVHINFNKFENEEYAHKNKRPKLKMFNLLYFYFNRIVKSKITRVIYRITQQNIFDVTFYVIDCQ